MEMLSFLDMDM